MAISLSQKAKIDKQFRQHQLKMAEALQLAIPTKVLNGMTDEQLRDVIEKGKIDFLKRYQTWLNNKYG